MPLARRLDYQALHYPQIEKNPPPPPFLRLFLKRA